MKAELDSKGTLMVSAQSALEAYALDQWFDNYKPKEQGKSTLCIFTNAREWANPESEDGQ